MKKAHLILASVILQLAMALSGYANHIVVGTPSLTGKNTTDDYVYVQFDLSWDNSWRDNVNWDAVWVFVKYKVTGDIWKHATLNTSGHTAPSGSTINTPSDGKGVFIYRSANGTGTFSLTNVQLRWNYGTDGVADDATVTVQVIAIEMVYVPTGIFAAGSGGSENSCFTLTTINTGDATTAPSGTGGFSGSAEGGYPTGQTAPDNASWPNGYSAFYCMKYEISQGQYADFLNTLTSTQDGNRFPNENGNYRHTIGGSQGSRSAGVPDRACNYLSWIDGCAYLDWACLGPMTELEFEKACRGTVAPVANEYAWGNTNIAGSAYTLSNDGRYNEAIAANYASDPTGNASYSITDGGIYGPLRCGIFATNSSTRAEAGAGCYGVMEMSGNLWERTVTIENATGRGFTGTHGDGALSTNGNATNSDWPGYVATEVTGATGSGFRGGSYINSAINVRVSDRLNAAYTALSRYYISGFRGVRSATESFTPSGSPSSAQYRGGFYDGHDMGTSTVLVEVKIFLEGPYDAATDEMTTVLNSGGHIPTTSPYSEDDREVSSIPDNITDWVLVQLRSTASGAAAVSKSAFLHKDGRIVADDGTTGQISLEITNGDYFIVVKHRNHLAVMSATAQALNGSSSTLYDFTVDEATPKDKYYGADAKELETGVYGMYTGDANSNDQVQNDDKNDYWKVQVGTAGYKSADFNLNGEVQNDDKNDYWKNNVGKGTQVP